MRCLAAGLFIYMGFFELMPPLPHGQWPALKYFLAFSAGFTGNTGLYEETLDVSH